jgi:hypothetical protein
MFQRALCDGRTIAFGRCFPGVSRGRVLVVDNDPSIREVVADILETETYLAARPKWDPFTSSHVRWM